jgi:hypothetical protein
LCLTSWKLLTNADDRKTIENVVIVAIAGEAGQAALERRSCDLRLPSAEGDYEFVMKLANWLYADPADRDAFIERQQAAACKLVSDPVCTRQIRCVAKQLNVLTELTYDQVIEWMDLTGRECNQEYDV